MRPPEAPSLTLINYSDQAKKSTHHHHKHQVLENEIKPGGSRAREASDGNNFLILDAQISIYSYCCYLGGKISDYSGIKMYK